MIKLRRFNRGKSLFSISQHSQINSNHSSSKHSSISIDKLTKLPSTLHPHYFYLQFYQLYFYNNTSQSVQPSHNIYMFRPTLKRPKNTFTSTLDTRNQSIQSSRPRNKDHPIKVIPDFFFQDSKSKFLNINSRSNKQTGVLNTMQFHYPKQVQQEISDANGCGQIMLASDIFCFYKNETAYFWRYSNDDYLVPRKYLKYVFEYPISSLSLKEIDISQGFNKPTIMVAVACGYKIKLFTLKNFELEKFQVIPDVEYMKIQIQGYQAISKLDIVIQPYGNNGNFNILIVYGNTSGKVSIFDFTNKKKIINDNWKTYLERVVTPSSRTETFYKQIIQHQGFFYCLCQKLYKINSFSKKLQRLFRNPQGHVQSEQFLQIYKMQFNEYDQKRGDSYETKSILSRFTLHEQISERNLHNKIVKSFGNCFREKRQIGESLQTQIQSMSKSDYVTILFKNGDSIQIDQNISFAATIVSPPLIHSQFQMHQQIPKVENNSRDILRIGYGDQIQLFDDYMIAGQNQKTIYFIEFNSNNLKFPFKTNSFWKYDLDKYERRPQPNSRYILFAGSSMYLVQKITKPEVLLLYSLSMSNSDLYYSEKIPQQKLFKEKIADFIKLWGEIKVAYLAIQALMIVKSCENKNIYIRQDIVERIHRQLIQEQQGNNRYKENENLLQREYYKNIYFLLEKSVEEYLWKIFFMLKNHQIQIEKVFPQEKGYTVDVSSLAFQMLLSEILSETTQWNNKFFCLQRKKVYHMISYTEIVGGIVADFMNHDEQLFRINQSKFDQLQTKNKSIRDMITVPVREKVQASQHQFYEMINLNFDKIALLMKIYDFISESDINNRQFPTFHQILRGGHDNLLLEFSFKIISILEMNNDILLNQLDDKFPQLQISLVRKFLFWKKVHCENAEKKAKKTDHDITSDEIDIDETEGLDSMMVPAFYESCFEKYFIQQNEIAKSKTKLEKQKQNSQCIAKVSSLILAVIRKINELRRREISLNNYKNQKKSMANYFSKITIIGIDHEYNHTQYCRQFFIEKCQKIFSSLFDWYGEKKIYKEDVQIILEKVKKEIPIEVKRKIAEKLQKHGIKELKTVIYEREIMINTGRESEKVVSNGNVQRKQLVQGSMRVV